MTQRLAVWLAEHDRARRVLLLVGSIHVLCLWSLACAPQASASAGSAAMSWTGLRDPDGVPLASYFLSVVGTKEAALNNGQSVNALPSTWMPWVAKAIDAAMWHSTVAWWLTNEAVLMMAVLGFALWLLRFSLSSAWLVALAHLGQPVYAAVRTLTYDLMLGPIAVTICGIIAGHHWLRGRPARAYSLAGSAAIMAVLTFTIFRHPIDDLVSEHGLLGMARQTGFQLAQDLRGSSYAPGQSLDGQLDALMSQLVSSTVRPALQLMNFGTVIDDISPACRAAWNAAIIHSDGQGPGPVHAMKACGAVAAATHAQQLGANDFLLGLLFLVAGMILALFIAYVGLSTMLVGAKTTYYCIVGVPALMLGMTGWPRAKAFAHRCAVQVMLHGAQMIIFTLFVALSAVLMAHIMTTPHLGHGGVTVVPRMMLLMVCSVIGCWLFHYIDKHFYTDSLSTIGHQIGGAWNIGRDHVVDEYGDIVASGRRAKRMFGRRTGSDEEAGGDSAADTSNSQEPLPGLDAVKPRPHRPPAATRSGARATSGAVEVGAEDIAATEARTAVAGSAVAEGGAALAAPEVVLPMAVGEAAVHHVRDKDQQLRRRQTTDASVETDPADDQTQQTEAAMRWLNEPADHQHEHPEPLSLPVVSGRPKVVNGIDESIWGPQDGVPNWETPEFKRRAEAAQRRAIDFWSGNKGIDDIGSVEDYMEPPPDDEDDPGETVV